MLTKEWEKFSCDFNSEIKTDLKFGFNRRNSIINKNMVNEVTESFHTTISVPILNQNKQK